MSAIAALQRGNCGNGLRAYGQCGVAALINAFLGPIAPGSATSE